VPGDEAFQLAIVVRGLGVGHQLADGDERGLVRDFHHRQAPPVGLGNQGRRNGLVRQPDSEADAHRACPLDLPDEPALVRRAAQPHAGGEDKFAAVEEPLRVLLFGHGHPVDVLMPGGFREARLGELQGRDSKQGGE
jgi:hypothetical protein